MLRWCGVRQAGHNFLSVLCRRSQPYPQQHLSDVTVICSSCVCSPTTSRASVLVFSTRDDRRGQEAIVSSSKQVVTVVTAWCAAEVMFNEVFAPAIARLANLSMQTGKFPAAGATTAEENRTRQFIAGELQTNFQSGNCLQGHQETCADSSATTSARFYQLQWLPVCLSEGTFYRECIVGGSGWCMHSCRQKGSHSADRSIDLSAAFDTVDHEILFKHLQTKFGVEECHWPRSGLTLMSGLSMRKLISTSQLLSSSRSVSL